MKIARLDDADARLKCLIRLDTGQITYTQNMQASIYEAHCATCFVLITFPLLYFLLKTFITLHRIRPHTCPCHMIDARVHGRFYTAPISRAFLGIIMMLRKALLRKRC